MNIFEISGSTWLNVGDHFCSVWENKMKVTDLILWRWPTRFYVSSSNEARSTPRKAKCHRSKIHIDRLPLHYKIGYFKSPQSGIRDTPFRNGLKVVSIHYFNLCGTQSCFTWSCFVRTRYVEASVRFLFSLLLLQISIQ